MTKPTNWPFNISNYCLVILDTKCCVICDLFTPHPPPPAKSKEREREKI